MTSSRSPLLRSALHVLLALALLLQASASLAMHASPAKWTNGEPAARSAMSAVAVPMPPPCHALLGATVDADAAPAADCCNDSALGESCRWACAQAFGAAPTLLLPALRARAGTPLAAPILPAPHWSAQSPLRPPIG